jgi:predicted O-methyltransferase YrrM
MMGARRVLEVGTLGGYSTIRLARGVGQGGVVVTLELDPHHANVARENIEGAGLSGRVELREGRAIDSLDRMIAEGVEPFDFFFIDADKSSNPAYLERAVALSRSGSVIVVDNVVRDGRILDEGSDSPDIIGTRGLFDVLHDHPRLETTAIQMVGSKGYDGFALAVVGP